MSDRSQLMLFEVPAVALTRSVAGSCVPTSALRARARDSASGRAAGLPGGKCSGSSGDCDPFFSSLKTCLASELSALTGCSLLWKESATPAGRSWSVLSTSERRIGAIASGSSEDWCTPRAVMFPESPQVVEARRAKQRDQMFAGGKRWGSCMNLHTQTLMWQTPSASTAQAGCRSRSGKRKDELLLIGQVIASSPEDAGGARTWPTPASRDWKSDEHAPAAQARNSPCLPAAAAIAGLAGPASPSTHGKPRGSLNPAWVAQLQGAPDGWLDLPDATLCELWETATRRKQRKR
jgi:hypothetical protein